MNLLDWIAVGAGAFIGACGLLLFYLRLIQEREKNRLARFRIERDMIMIDRSESSFASSRPQDVREIKDLIREQTRILHEIAARPVVVNVESNLASTPRDSYPGSAFIAHGADPGSTESLIREMSHSLNTPLSQIEIALSLLGDSSDKLPIEDQASLQRAISSVAVCKAFIQAFRYAILTESDDVENLSGGALAELLTSATTTQAAQHEVEVVANLPAEISEYNDAFLLAALIPLVENAIESSPPGDRVLVSYEEQHDRTIISVQNHSGSPPPDSMFEPRFSTKPDHDGMGLVVVTRLLNSVPGAKFTHDWSKSLMTFQIELPRRLR